jgi:formylglycine-generating enzyme required for sulfatase activity
LAKHELTQAQWQRVRGQNPSYNGAGDAAAFALHPVQMVSWNDCSETLRRLGLALPTEAQWEHAARGGTPTPRWTDAVGVPIDRAINLADRAFAAAAIGSDSEPDLDDAFALHAPVDALAPNPFGLCHVLGNVLEWCADWYDEGRTLPLRAGDGAVGAPADLEFRCYRGGSYWQRLATCASRGAGARRWMRPRR